MLAGFDGRGITLREIHRFPNSFSLLGDRAYWDLLRLVDHLKQGIAKCGAPVRSMAVDSWGVDFGLLDRAGALVGMPRSYRDNAFNGENMAEAVEALGGAEWLFSQTYLANMDFNSLFQLYSMRKRGEGALDAAGTLLMIPNLIEYFLTGVKHSEYTIAATSQLYDMKHKRWAAALLEKLGLSPDLLTAVDPPGTVLGSLTPDLERETGRKLTVISVAGHDTASAVSAIPAGREFMYLSSGTWSLMGFCSDRLIEDREIVRRNISNEGSRRGGYRPTVNIVGLWILQECQRQWNAGDRSYTFEEAYERFLRLYDLEGGDPSPGLCPR
jgi:sugar (pentulose or hexulose) kinase